MRGRNVEHIDLIIFCDILLLGLIAKKNMEQTPTNRVLLAADQYDNLRHGDEGTHPEHGHGTVIGHTIDDMVTFRPDNAGITALDEKVTPGSITRDN